MTLRLLDGYDYLPTGLTATQLGKLMSALGWYGASDSLSAITVLGTSGTALNQGRGLSFAVSDFGWTVYRKLGIRYTGTAFITGRRLNMFNGWSTNLRIGFYDSSAAQPQCWITFGSVGQINVFGANGFIAATPAGTFPANGWFFLEMKIICGALGSIQIRVNTKVVLTLANVDLASTGDVNGIDVEFMSANGDNQGGFAADDYYLSDTVGTVNNDYIGNSKVPAQLPAGPGSLTQWAIGGSAPAATNWQSVLDFLLDDGTFTESDTVGQQDLYALSALITSPVIYGAQVTGLYRQDDATQRTVRNTVKSGTTEAEGVDNYTDSTYTGFSDIWELDPNTALGWSGAAMNALEVGPKLTL